jgi:signal transduction histidine kinase
MRAIGSSASAPSWRRRLAAQQGSSFGEPPGALVDWGWAAFAALNLAVMVAWPDWETIPFHLIWISLTLLYGFRVWHPLDTGLVLASVCAATGASIMADAFRGVQLWGELFEVPLMSAMFLAMVWHARRRLEAMRLVEQRAEERRALLDRQEGFLHDVSHELLTPVTIARGHLELLHPRGSEVEVALDELQRIDRILGRLLLLAKTERPDFVVPEPIDLEAMLEDVFLRWSELGPRAWRLGDLASGTLVADREALRVALDALLENAVKYSAPGTRIELAARADGELARIVIRDQGCGVAADAVEGIFERFGRADAARTRSHGGAGLGLAIVDAVAKAHGGRCEVSTAVGVGSVFTLSLPGFAAAQRSSATPV